MSPNHKILIRNWRDCLGTCSVRIRKLQEAMRPPEVEIRIRRALSALVNAFRLAHLAIGDYELQISKRELSDKRRVVLMESAIMLGSGMALFLSTSDLACNMIREYNWSFRRRITESGGRGISIEESGSRRISMLDLGILDSIVSCVTVSTRLASENFVLSREF